MTVLKGKNILLCVTGSIAAYKTVDLYRRLKKEGANIKIIVGLNASKFISPYIFESFGEDVYTDDAFKSPLSHIFLSKFADLILVAPATYNTINKITCGIADNLITLTISASSDLPKILVPAMNGNMYSNKILQDNIKRLEKYNFHVIKPEKGELACGDFGEGKFPDIEDIVYELESKFTKKTLSGKRVLVTAGATREYLDPVRFLSNGSSGKMGISIANEAVKRGADVTLISLNIEKSYNYIGKSIDIIACKDFGELKNCLDEEFKKADILFMAAAVSDFSFKNRCVNKIKKSDFPEQFKLLQNEDLLKRLSKIKRENQTVFGFAAETDSVTENGIKKLKEKSLDFIFINDVSKNIIGGNENEGILVRYNNGKIEKKQFARKLKDDLSRELLDEILK